MIAPSFSTKRSLAAFLGLIFIIYCLFQARFLILGPRITISHPQDGEVVPTPAVTLSGYAYNAAWLSLNGQQIFTDEEGYWEEALLLAEGTSIISIRAEDRFGREQEESIRLILK